MGHYMTKDNVKIQCENCMYWGNTKRILGVTGSCGNANHPHYLQGRKTTALTNYNHTCEWFWPKDKYRK